MPRQIFVSTTGSDSAPGSEEQPLRTINCAAQRAQPGDTVVVRAGEYREWVRPARGGIDDSRRITYRAAEGERVVIKGSEPVTGWVRVADPAVGPSADPATGPDISGTGDDSGARASTNSSTIWRADVPNSLFGDFNPFAVELAGDWLVEPDPYRREMEPPLHLGDVFLNGRSFYEVPLYDDLAGPQPRLTAVDRWTGVSVAVPEPEASTYVWYAEVGDEATTIWANFQGADPNEELVEINVRPSVFSPVVQGVNYVTVSGFEMAQGAPQWAPPTAAQQGLISPGWAKGWIIEDNAIYSSKCSGISLGKEASTGNNFALERGNKPGYQYQVETVMAASRIGWDREHVGSHVVRHNTIFDCGQTGIVGHLGCIFSRIEDNHIYRIGLKREYFGHEIAGIKLHAAIDAVLEHNRIHDCSLGVWLDWQAQGTRVSRNVMYSNNRDLFIEVSHGPYVVDHNMLASRASVEVVCQGGAYVNNLIGGSVRLEAVLDRSTPYHVPHSTQIVGLGVVSGGDDRWIGNVFFGGDLDRAYVAGGAHHAAAAYGTVGYAGYPSDLEEYLSGIDRSAPDHLQFHDVRQPVYAASNVYVGGAQPVKSERDAVVLGFGAGGLGLGAGFGGGAGVGLAVTEVEDGRGVVLELGESSGSSAENSGLLGQIFAERVGVVTGADLPPTRLSDAAYDDVDGGVLRLDVDLTGAVKQEGRKYPAGPFARLPEGGAPIRLW